MLHIDPYLLGHTDITVLSFATIGHVGKIPPKNISATGTFRRMRSSSPTFVTGQEQPPPKSGCVRACTLVTRASPDCEKLPTELPTERKSRDFGLNFTEEAFSTTSLAERFFSPRPRSFVSLAAFTHLTRLSSAARTAQDSRLRWTRILYDSLLLVDRAAPGSCA